MRKTKIAITLDEQFIEDIDKLVSEHVFQKRSQAIQEAVEEKLKRLKRTRLAKECTKLDISFEKAMASDSDSFCGENWKNDYQSGY
ncbi:MAG: CopG family transcriptional regulator [Planctomycetes bacterium]|nr:CopG family transcriptional regulator [Planctomycetota bacterium]